MPAFRVVYLGICIAFLAASFTLSGCISPDSAAGHSQSFPEVSDSPSSVAAIVNGHTIQESEVSDAIERVRVSNNLESDDSWINWLNQNSKTAREVREGVIQNLVDERLLFQAADELGVILSEEDINQEIEEARNCYNNDNEWCDYLKSIGETEQTYRNQVTLSLLKGKIGQLLVEDSVNDASLLEYANAFAQAYGGAKRSSEIVFHENDEQLANDVLERLRNGFLDFDAAVQQYSISDSKASNGDIGWNLLQGVPSPQYAQALSSLGVDEISNLIHTEDSIRIIKCTDVFQPSAEISSLEQLPEAFQEELIKSVSSTNRDEVFSDWFTNYRDEADIVVNEMPDDLPYDDGLKAN